MRTNRVKNVIVTCECCGNGFFTSKDADQERARRGSRTSCSPSCSAKLKHQDGGQSGELNPNWKGGISANNYHYKKLQIKRYPERVNARRKVHYAVKTGKLRRGLCEVCGAEQVQAHHDDYSKPLDVRWLCKQHHDMEHK